MNTNYTAVKAKLEAAYQEALQSAGRRTVESCRAEDHAFAEGLRLALNILAMEAGKPEDCSIPHYVDVNTSLDNMRMSVLSYTYANGQKNNRPKITCSTADTRCDTRRISPRPPHR